MTNNNQTTAPMTLAELKAWVEETCELSELLQTKDYKSYLPEEKQEEFEAIAFSVFNCLESFLIMLEDDELHYQPKPIEEESDLDNQANEMTQYNELMKEVEDSDKEARVIAYGDTIHEYIDKRTEQLKEQVDVDNEYQGLEYYNTELNKED